MNSGAAASVDRQMLYRYILFDWDGCLAQTLAVYMTAFKATFEHFGLFPDERAIARQFGDWHGPKSLGVSERDYELFVEMLLKAVNTKLPNVTLYPGARDLIAALQANDTKIGLITSSAPESLRHALRNSGIESYLDVVVTARDVTHHKPHPESIELAISAMGGTSDEAVMIGDSSKDLGAAKNAGIDSILVYPEGHALYYDLEELRQFDPTYVCGSFEEVRVILLRDREQVHFDFDVSRRTSA